jgi:hypothetical protein
MNLIFRLYYSMKVFWDTTSYSLVARFRCGRGTPSSGSKQKAAYNHSLIIKNFILNFNILVLFSHQFLSLPSGLFPFGFPSRTVHSFHLSPCAPHCPLLPLLAVSTLTMFKALIMQFSSSCCYLRGRF